MYRPPVRLRRARRTDFVGVMRALASNGLPVPPPDRGTLRGFRRLVSDLGTDLYVALRNEQVVGVVHVTYTRQLVVRLRARIEVLAVDGELRGQGIGSCLTALASRRAHRRGCADLRCEIENDSLRSFLTRRGWVGSSGVLRLDLPTKDEPRISPTVTCGNETTTRCSDA